MFDKVLSWAHSQADKTTSLCHDELAQLKLRLSFYFVFSYVLSWALYACFYTFVFPNPVGIIACLFACSFCLVALRPITSSKHATKAIDAVHYMGVITLGIITIVTGSLDSYIPFFMAFKIVTFFLLRGATPGIIATGLAAVLAIAIFVLDISTTNNFYFFDFQKNSLTYKTFNLVVWISSTSILSFLAYLFLTMIQGAYSKAQKQKQSAEHEKENARIQQQIAETARLQTERKSRDIQSIMANIKQGIFTISHNAVRHATIDQDYSVFLNTLFNIPPAGATFADKHPDELFGLTTLNSEELSNLRMLIEGALGENVFQFEVNAHLVPPECEVNSRICEIELSPILNSQDETEKILVVLKDVTSIRKLQKEQEKNSRQVQKLIEIASINQKEYSLVMNAALSYINECQDIASQKQEPSNREELDQVYRNIHTIKGLARNYNLKSISTSAHIAEEKIYQFIKGESFTRTDIKAVIAPLEASIQEITELAREKLNRNTDISSINIDQAQLNDWYLEGNQIMKHMTDRELKDKFEDMINDIRRTYSLTTGDLIQSEQEAVIRISNELGKTPPALRVKNNNIFLDRNHSKVLKSCFSHLIRNSLDHGIESDAVRSQKHKQIPATIEVTVDSNDRYLIIYYQDDGAGIDVKKLTARAHAKGLIDEHAEISPKILKQMIFEPGVSTKDKVSEISGRGVGMDAAKKMIEDSSGVLELNFLQDVTADQDYVPIQIVIKVPRQTFGDDVSQQPIWRQSS